MLRGYELRVHQDYGAPSCPMSLYPRQLFRTPDDYQVIEKQKRKGNIQLIRWLVILGEAFKKRKTQKGKTIYLWGAQEQIKIECRRPHFFFMIGPKLMTWNTKECLNLAKDSLSGYQLFIHSSGERYKFIVTKFNIGKAWRGQKIKIQYINITETRSERSNKFAFM